MKLSEMIAAVGDENIKLQNLFGSITSAKKVKGGTSITFVTDQISATEIMLGGNEKVGLVVWIPRDKLPKL